MEAKRSTPCWRGFLLPALLLVGSCGDNSSPAGPPPPQQSAPAVRIEIAPSAVLLTAPGQNVHLEAIGFDAAGDTTEVDVTWSTSDASIATVAADGTLTARADLGSAQVTARVGTMSAAPVLVVVAQPVDGAVLVSDEQFVSGPTAVSPLEDYGVGWEYAVRLSAISAPAAGTVLLASGGAPIAGRVVRTASVGSDIEVTLALMSLPDMFERLSIEQTIDMAQAPIAVDAQLLQRYRVQHSLDGEILLTPRAAGRTWSVEAAQGPPDDVDSVEFKLGPFECTASGGLPSLDVPEPEIKIEHSLSAVIGYTETNGFEKLTIVGNSTANFEYRPVFKAEFEGKIDCNYAPVHVIIPVSGFATVVFAGIVPLGVGMELEGNLTIAEVGFEVAASAGASLELGVACPGGGACQSVRTFTPRPVEPTFEFIAPASWDDQVHLELGATAYAVARLAFGSAVWEDTQFEVIEARAGIKQGVDLMTANAQVNDDGYASGFDLTSVITLGPGEHLQKALDVAGGLLGVDLEFTINLFDDLDPLAESPKGTLTIEPTAVTAGDTTDVATFTVELEPVTYVKLESVDSVQIFWKRPDDAGGFTLEPSMPDCNVLSAASGQKTFECETSFTEEHIGQQTFAAFVYARLFDVPVPIPLEIAVDTVDVQPNVACGVPGEWDVPRLLDESYVEEYEGAGTGTLTGPTLDYLSVSGGATSTASGSNWSPSAYLDAEAVDYVRVISLENPDSVSGALRAITYVTGSATATVSEPNCCGTYGDADAELEIYSSWAPGMRLEVAAGASWSGDLGPTDEAQVSDTATVWLGWAFDDSWQGMTTSIYGSVRHRGGSNSSSVTGSLSATILDVVDDNGPVPVVICSAAGYNYGTFVAASGPVVASRPVRQASNVRP